MFQLTRQNFSPSFSPPPLTESQPGKHEGLRAWERPLGYQVLLAMATWGTWVAPSLGTNHLLKWKVLELASTLWNSSWSTTVLTFIFPSSCKHGSPLISACRLWRQPAALLWTANPFITSSNWSGFQEQLVPPDDFLCLERKSQREPRQWKEENAHTNRPALIFLGVAGCSQSPDCSWEMWAG